MMESITFILVSAFMAVAAWLLMRAAAANVDDDDMRDFIKSMIRADADIREMQAREAAGRPGHTYYDVFRRASESEANRN